MTTGMWAVVVVVAIGVSIGLGLWVLQLRASRFERQATEDEDDFT